MPRLLSLLIAIMLVAGCGGGGGSDGSNNLGTRVPFTSVSGCFLEDYPDPTTSEYILPYQVGMSFTVNQGNCGQFITHKPNCTGILPGGVRVSCGDRRYAYDFFMPIGIVILAARSGTVVTVVDGFSNATNSSGQENIISIEHDDGTIAAYLHLSPNTLMVSLGDIVNQGDPIALSGSSGLTDGPTFRNPHLHFEVLRAPFTNCTPTVFFDCVNIPVTFRNANPLDAPLLEGRSYTALPF